MRQRTRNGFTLVEVMFALVMLTVAVLGMTVGVARFVNVVSGSEIETAAMQLADDRISIVTADPNYLGLDSMYVTTETEFEGLPGFTRQTAISRVGGEGEPVDFKRILVTVSGPGLTDAVKRSASVAAP